ncbi:hypothetical protein EAF00_004088 [Botryotinia globosa]|nr:hypothetical protein EAF00_004088 [Botryotinia globosa]
MSKCSLTLDKVQSGREGVCFIVYLYIKKFERFDTIHNSRIYFTMTDKKLVVVLGATGAQGGPTTRYILKHLSHTYRVRAVTRDPTKPSAQALSKCGAEVISADYDIPDSIEAALSGAHAIFSITNFWEQNSLDIEVAQAKTINRIASKLPHLEHYIY